MSGYTKLSCVFLLLSGVLWYVNIDIVPPRLELVSVLAAIACSLAFVSFLALGVSRRLRCKSSPYRVFAVVNALTGAAVLGYAIYDIRTDTGWFAGLLGTLLLVLVLPLILLFLLVDLVLWLRSRSKNAGG